jgi:AAA+ ATPase superfamily predicted ATPase
VNTIIEVIASGENQLSIIAAKVNEKEPTVLYSLNKLIEVGLVERRKCITDEKNKKKTQYILRDSMFRFWYSFIPKAYSVIEMGQGEFYYDKVVKPAIHSYMGSIFEDMCRYYTLEQGVQNRFGCFVTKVGTYWGTELIEDKDGKKSQIAADIDVVALSEVDKTVLIGECKFTKAKIDKEIYETLVRRAALITGKYRLKNYLLFSLNGYSQWVSEIDNDKLILITLEDMYR